MRTIFQWNEFEQDLDIEPLLSYEVNPVTVFYLGATRRMHDYHGMGLTNYLSDENLIRETERQYFAKIQYLFQI